MLIELLNAIEELIPLIDSSVLYKDHGSEFAFYKNRVNDLIIGAFSQQDLNELSSMIRPIIYTYRDWMPPLVKDAEGAWKVPEWFDEFEMRHQVVMKLASELRITGEY